MVIYPDIPRMSTGSNSGRNLRPGVEGVHVTSATSPRERHTRAKAGTRVPDSPEGRFARQRTGARWEGVYTLPVMKRGAETAVWTAFFISLRGRLGTFLAFDPHNAVARGSVPGTPLVKGATQTGNSLVTDGWGLNQSNILLAGDYIIVDTWRFKDEEPANGDIVVFRAPESGISYIKRIAGMPGDSVSLQGDQLARNGQIVSEPYTIYEGSGQVRQPIPELNVRPNQYLLLGDNRNNSRDSRHFGLVPRENIVGRIAHIYYSSDDEGGVRWSRIPTEF